MLSFSSNPSINCWRNNYPSTLLPPCLLSVAWPHCPSFFLDSTSQGSLHLALPTHSSPPPMCQFLPHFCQVPVPSERYWPFKNVSILISLHVWKLMLQKPLLIPLTICNSFPDKHLAEMPMQIWLQFDCSLSLWVLTSYLLLCPPLAPYLTNLSFT